MHISVCSQPGIAEHSPSQTELASKSSCVSQSSSHLAPHTHARYVSKRCCDPIYLCPATFWQIICYYSTTEMSVPESYLQTPILTQMDTALQIPSFSAKKHLNSLHPYEEKYTTSILQIGMQATDIFVIPSVSTTKIIFFL